MVVYGYWVDRKLVPNKRNVCAMNYTPKLRIKPNPVRTLHTNARCHVSMATIIAYDTFSKIHGHRTNNARFCWAMANDAYNRHPNMIQRKIFWRVSASNTVDYRNWLKHAPASANANASIRPKPYSTISRIMWITPNRNIRRMAMDCVVHTMPPPTMVIWKWKSHMSIHFVSDFIGVCCVGHVLKWIFWILQVI